MKELDKTKAYDLRDLNDEQLTKLAEWFLINLHKNQATVDLHDVIEFLKEWLNSRPFSFYKNKDGDYLWGFGQNSILDRCINALTLFEPTLKIGDTFECDGFICRVESEAKKWAYNRKYNEYTKVKQSELTHKKLTEITDQEFIKQLEKHAK